MRLRNSYRQPDPCLVFAALTPSVLTLSLSKGEGRARPGASY